MKDTMSLEEYKAKLDAGVYDYQYKADYEDMAQQYSEVFKLWGQAQADADRRLVALKGALAVIEALQDHHCGGMCPEGHEETMNAANHYQEIIAKELDDADIFDEALRMTAEASEAQFDKYFEELEITAYRRLELLERVEWLNINDVSLEMDYECPVCDCTKYKGHAEDCELERELADD